MKKNLIIVLLTLVVSAGFYFSNQGQLLFTSVIGLPEHAPFDGTTYPIKKVPNWVKLSGDEYDYAYSQFDSSDLINIPEYNADDLKISTDDLTWGNEAHNKIRNEKITYSVPFLGNYKLDGHEHVGSHPAVDIKVPMNTPIYAIANGVVVKVANQSSGFGNHIVIRHNDFPTLEDSNAKEPIYSSYSHLNKTLVQEGQVVKKGEQIGLSGESGTATTPHLHFQIDTDKAPWHPYWLFNWQDQQKAGNLSFFEAINVGLNMDKAEDTVIHPLNYVQKYLNSAVANSYVASTSNNTEVNEEEPEEEQESAVEEDTNVDVDLESEPAEQEETLDPPVLEFQFVVRSNYYVDQNSSFSILLKDQYGRVYENGFDGEVTVASVNGRATVRQAIINQGDFDENGRLQTEFKRMKEGRDKLKISYNGEDYYSDWFEIDEDGEALSFRDVSEDNEYYEAIIYLAEQGIVAGYPDGTFKPNQTVSRVEALKFIMEGVKEDLSEGDLKFRDVSRAEWYARYLYTAIRNRVVDGYPDGTFKPAGTVNKAEFFKMLLNGMGVSVPSSVSSDPADDVKSSDWFAPFIAKSKELGVIDSDKMTIRPANGMTRGEVAEAIYRLLTIVE